MVGDRNRTIGQRFSNLKLLEIIAIIAGRCVGVCVMVLTMSEDRWRDRTRGGHNGSLILTAVDFNLRVL